VLSRAGSPGIQRYAANWLGDNMSRWDHLWLSIPMGSGLSISGQSFVGADIGGFGEDSNPELLSRWIQYGALTPFARNHNVAGQIDQYPWSFGPEVLEIYRNAVNLRYRLMPYLYSAFVKASQTGAPIQRPLIFDYQYDSGAKDTDDQFLLGDQILVAPVTEPKANERGVYLPAGEWFDWHADTSLVSLGERHRVLAPAEQIPVFVKAGSVIPLWLDSPLSTANYYPTEIELRVFVPSSDCRVQSLFQEDDGLTFGALQDQKITTNVELVRYGHTLTLRASCSGAGFEAFARKSLKLTFVTGSENPIAPVVLENSGQDFELVFDLG
jgi:alpha-glucosidase